MPLDPFLSAAAQAVRRAGRVLLAHFGKPVRVDRAEHHDLKLRVDRLAEKAILSVLRRHFPDHSVLSEECGRIPGKGAGGDYTWIVDPMDGSVNFFHGVPHFSSSVALDLRGRRIAAAVLDPGRKELFTAARGRGAYLNGRRIRVSGRRRLSESIVAAGFVKDRERMRRGIEAAARLVRRARKIRVMGSVVLDLCWIAAGRLDGFYECGIWPWDAAGGALAVEEAGGRVASRGVGTEGALEVAASTSGIHRELLRACGMD